ncbi:glycoside hydrolase family 43 protein [Reichenbachiella versicolor]|uniref:glycoside hydrolase family 43 protein n=1 Tax=Reichenbachiella versicolor TaxID=1821036 RepID=UPI000D6E11C8|nr:glycoside hydrolase family 43 protein [Reichenbachiella versicolor]
MVRSLFTLIVVLLIYSSEAKAQPDRFRNPILPGFYPDPSICRVGEYFYIVNSSFEWYPALPIHRSKDLVNWEKIGHAIHRSDQLDMGKGVKDSNGIFAPTIRYRDGLFYVITTCIGCNGNFYVTAEDPAGPWSDPIWVKNENGKGARGIDPSLFWDDDGRCYYIGTGLLGGDRKEWKGKGGIWLQEIDLKSGKLIGAKTQLTLGYASNARWPEGPHIYKVEGQYLLLIGEGGTNSFHSVTVFNSKNLRGPYKPNDSNPVMTHRHLAPFHPIDQTGHADLVQDENGNWYSVMLGKRPVDGFIMLARETFLAEVSMMRNPENDITPIYNPGVGSLQLEQKRPNLPWSPVPEKSLKYNFEDEDLGLDWNMLRTPKSKWYSTGDGLQLQLRPEVLNEFTNPSFVGMRVTDHVYQVTTELSFKTGKENEKAGLVIYRRSTSHFQLLKGKDGITLTVTSKIGVKDEPVKTEEVSVPYKKAEVILHARVNKSKVQFYFGESVDKLKPIGGELDYTILSDEVTMKFNGVYSGLYATGSGESSNQYARFDKYEYQKGE